MASLSEVGIRPMSPLDLESLHVDLNAPCRAAFRSVRNYFLGRYFLVHMAEKISIARETTELGLFCHAGSGWRTGFPARIVVGWSSPFTWGKTH